MEIPMTMGLTMVGYKHWSMLRHVSRGGKTMVKYYKVWKGGKVTYKTTSIGMARDYRKANGGVIKERHWVMENE